VLGGKQLLPCLLSALPPVSKTDGDRPIPPHPFCRYLLEPQIAPYVLIAIIAQPAMIASEWICPTAFSAAGRACVGVGSRGVRLERSAQLRLLTDRRSHPHSHDLNAGFIAMPGVLAAPPYKLNEAQIGLANLPIGFGSLLSAPFGGYLADISARRRPAHASGRMIPGCLFTLLLFPAMIVAYGWQMQKGMSLAGILGVSAFLSVPLCVYMPGE
jgi:hypothetical protein